jgi:ferredoxin-type protein NapF
MRVSRRQFLCGDLSGRCALLRDGAAWPVKAEIGAACIAFGQVVCRSCGDACETRAIRFSLRAGGVTVPELDTDACTGCGACVTACPVSAIAMEQAASIAVEA